MTSISPAKRRLGWLWVVLQAVLIATLLALPYAAPTLHIIHTPILIGWFVLGTGLLLFVFAFAALGKSFTPNPVPKENAAFVMHGIYRWIRHPMYTAVMLCAIGWSLTHGSFWLYALSATLVAFFWIKSTAEERWLVAQHEGYVGYRLRTGRFLPKVIE